MNISSNLGTFCRCCQTIRAELLEGKKWEAGAGAEGGLRESHNAKAGEGHWHVRPPSALGRSPRCGISDQWLGGRSSWFQHRLLGSFPWHSSSAGDTLTLIGCLVKKKPSSGDQKKKFSVQSGWPESFENLEKPGRFCNLWTGEFSGGAVRQSGILRFFKKKADHIHSNDSAQLIRVNFRENYPSWEVVSPWAAFPWGNSRTGKSKRHFRRRRWQSSSMLTYYMLITHY